MEQIRVIKEMRDADRNIRGRTGIDVRPRFMAWENVQGCLSSNKGKDFQTVLTEIVRIAQPDAPDVPLPEKGRWTKAGCLFGMGGDGRPFSVGWRVHDAQFWGVPQRRVRVSVVADFGDASAPEILFERSSFFGDSSESESEGQGSPTDSRAGFERASREDVETETDFGAEPLMVENHPNDSRAKIRQDGVAQALSSRMGTGGNNTPLVLEGGYPSCDCSEPGGSHSVNVERERERADLAGCVQYRERTTPRRTEHQRGSQQDPELSARQRTDFDSIFVSSKNSHMTRWTNRNIASTLVASDYKDSPCVAYMKRETGNEQ